MGKDHILVLIIQQTAARAHSGMGNSILINNSLYFNIYN